MTTHFQEIYDKGAGLPSDAEFTQKLSDFLAQKGFHAFDHIGGGAEATVIAPRDNREIVFRITPSNATIREPVPYTEQAIGMWEMEGSGNPVFTHTKIEVLPRLDMNVPRDEQTAFALDVEQHGMRIADRDMGPQPGCLTYTKANGETDKALMTPDSGAIRSTICNGKNPLSSDNNYAQHTHGEGHPSLSVQMENALEIIKRDDRLAELAPQVKANLINYANGIVTPNLTPSELAAAEEYCIRDKEEMVRIIMKTGVSQEKAEEILTEERAHLAALRANSEMALATAAKQLEMEGFTCRKVDRLPVSPVTRQLHEPVTAPNTVRTTVSGPKPEIPEPSHGAETPAASGTEKIKPVVDETLSKAKGWSRGGKWGAGIAAATAVVGSSWILYEHTRNKEKSSEPNPSATR